MKHAEYKYLEDTLSGRRQRDPEFESTMSEAIDPRVAERQRLIDSKTPEQREIEQRRYSLDTYGPEHMKRYARPIVTDKPLGELEIPGDQIRRDTPQARGHNDKKEERKNASPQQLKGHSGERPGPWRDKNGKPILQNHGACPQRQVLQIRA